MATTIRPVASRHACAAYVTQTLAGWHPGVARARWARHFMAGAAPLSAHERAAGETIRCALARAGAGRLREVVLQRCNDVALLAAFEAFGPRAAVLVDEAWDDLVAWQRQLAAPPEWFVGQLAELDRLFADGGAEVPVYVLPSPPGCVAGNGSMFVEHGATSLSCSGAPAGEPLVWMTLAHEIAHSLHQPRRIEPLLARHLAESPRAQQTERRYRLAPLSKQVSLPAYVAEIIIHALVPHGILARDGGNETRAKLAATLPDVTTTAADAQWGTLYDAWITRGALELTPAMADYLRRGNVVDQTIVSAALEVFERLLSSWQRAHA